MTRHSLSDHPDAAVREAWTLPSADVSRGLKALWWTVGPGGELAVMLVHRRYLQRSPYAKGWVGWGPKEPFTGELVTITGHEERRAPVEDVRIRPSHLALLPDSRFLLVGSRTFPSVADGVWESNAVVYSATGQREGEFCVGDDIPALVTDRHGGVWTAYGDEGIYGGHPESGAGLAGWNTDGRAIWHPRGRLPDHPLEGCTAATEDNHVWLVWYSGSGKGGTFLTRITASTGDVISFPSPVHDPDGFAVCGNQAVFTRRKHNQRTVELTRAALDGTTWTVTERHPLDVPGRVVMDCGQGREGTLTLRTGNTWLHIQA
ncbi:hypothetical protein OG585_55465 (plasmid) [Streptomyces sp. NBC_01340]|uniref:hypothetical protein n=1 Tax=Streptomyces sp. NBC_01340 TaxID=2903830 RepID=UPI002E1070C5|nr:hypothetical protein OG585_00015 [Streptomyces sp. NBC_01340]WSI43936.1 hypothetical protein OG585_46905 [Streptomyces sp. NBC_01340]WSI45871.1 hypothetical protein OG585_55465 [Streptomyces sp. NBC_01340]